MWCETVINNRHPNVEGNSMSRYNITIFQGTVMSQENVGITYAALEHEVCSSHSLTDYFN